MDGRGGAAGAHARVHGCCLNRSLCFQSCSAAAAAVIYVSGGTQTCVLSAINLTPDRSFTSVFRGFHASWSSVLINIMVRGIRMAASFVRPRSHPPPVYPPVQAEREERVADEVLLVEAVLEQRVGAADLGQVAGCGIVSADPGLGLEREELCTGPGWR